ARPGSFSEQLERSYSRDPAKVARLGTAFAGALQAGGVAATAKHFPGIGVPRVDEDTVASRIGLSQATLRRIDEAPFAAAVRTGAAGADVHPGGHRPPPLRPVLRPRGAGGGGADPRRARGPRVDHGPQALGRAGARAPCGPAMSSGG